MHVPASPSPSPSPWWSSSSFFVWFRRTIAMLVVAVFAGLPLPARRALAAPVPGPTSSAPSAAKAKPAAPMPSGPFTSTCVQDDAVPTPRGWQGWDRTAVIAWQAIEDAGGVVPEIEEDRTQSPPGWWRYPSPLRSEGLLDAEAKNALTGLYSAVPAGELAKGDILVRTHGVGVCGKMGVIGGKVEGQWVTIEVGPDGQSQSTRPASPLFFAGDGQTLLPQARAFRIRVKKDETLGHVRELRRDLDHLERTVGHEPPLLASGAAARQVVTEKIHDLVDEAWSLVADETFDVDRRELAGRALALGAYMGWPAAAVAAAAVLDDVLRRSPGRAGEAATRVTLARLRQHLAPTDATLRFVATADEVGVEDRELGLQVRWPVTWRLLGASANSETGLLANLITGRVLLPDGRADRGAAVVLSQRPQGSLARTTLARDGARKMFPTAKMKTLPAIVPGSRRAQFTERHEGTNRAGEVNTIERGGVVTFLVLNAPGSAYPKLRDEYAGFVRSLSVVPTAGEGAAPAQAPSPAVSPGASPAGAGGGGSGR